ncbi:MAG TPA: ferritin family protein [Oscillospiraceae bacterium]|nr:ferritin family protein [Oscillospiraceae bacterium]HPS35885.1 ferritin family protein [Oscillospiraceae bacterium]
MSTLTFAIQMETDGEQYYLKQAALNKGTSLQRAFLLLAETEKKHADLLRKKDISSDSSISDDILNAEQTDLFSGKDDYKREAEVVPGQLEVYAVALDMEQKSIDLYQKMLIEAKDKQVKQLMKFLVKQEQDHFALFNELITLLRRPKDWVENAEFGNREEY